MALKKDLKGKDPEVIQTELMETDQELEATGQKRKLRPRSNMVNESAQKKSKLDNAVSVAGPSNNSSAAAESPTTPTKRPTRAAAASKSSPAKAATTMPNVPVTYPLPDAGQIQSQGGRTTRTQLLPPSSNKPKEQVEQRLPDSNEGLAEGPERAIQAAPFSRNGDKRQKNAPNLTQIPNDETHTSTSLSSPPIKRYTRLSLLEAARNIHDEETQTSNLATSSPSKTPGRKVPGATAEVVGNDEDLVITGVFSGPSTRGRRKAQDTQQLEGKDIPRVEVAPLSLSANKGGRRKKLPDANQALYQEVLQTEIPSLPSSPKKRGRPKKEDIAVIPQPKLVKERTTKKLPHNSAKEVKWKIDVSSSQTAATADQNQGLTLSTKRPRIWTEERGDIMAMLPELNGSRCVNGLTWVMYETPMLMLDNTNTFMEIDWKDRDTNIFDLVTTRSFSCPMQPERQAPHLEISEHQQSIPFDEEEFKNIVQVHHNHPNVTIANDLSPHGPQTENMADDILKGQQSGLLNFNVPVMATGTTVLRTDNNPSERIQEGGAPKYRVIASAYTVTQEHSVKKEQPSYSFNDVPTIDTEPAVDRILDDASRLFEIPTSNVTSVQDATSMDIIHSPESPTAPLLPALPSDVHSTSNAPAVVHPLERVDVPGTPPVSEAAAAPEIQDQLTSYIPSPIPDELAAIVEAYVAGLPLTLLMSHSRLITDWSLALPEEYGFVMMGYFRILGIQEERLPPVNNLPGKKVTASRDFVTGQVRWHVTLQWEPGGEKYIFSDPKAKPLQCPWWSPPSPDSDDSESSKQPLSPNPNSKHEPEEQVKTTKKYRTARLEHPNWEFRHYAYDNVYHGLIPKHLLAPFGPQHFDDFFPLGWFCENCGRLNFQAAMRHRQCKSSFCKGLPRSVDSYDIELVYLRDPHDRHVVFLPNNSHPGYVRSRREDSSSGLITFSYETHEVKTPFLKHIFTSNLSEHQIESTDLLKQIQLDVELVRTTDAADPYFTYSTKGKQLRGDLTSPASQWLDVPECVNTCRTFMSQRLLDCGHMQSDRPPIGLLTVVSWITAGIKTIPVPINAKKHPVSVLCMGCDVVLNITLPASVSGNKPERAVEELGDQRLVTMNEDDDDQIEFADPSLGWVADDPETVALLQEQRLSSQQKRQPKLKIGKKISKDMFALTLVHGDMACFFGENFECSIKRGGTSLLVIATQK